MNLAIKKRKRVVEQAIANERLEGLQVSKESQRIADIYIIGKISSKEAAKRIRTHYGILSIKNS